jgi:predicted RNase H-like HicB family nuclease
MKLVGVIRPLTPLTFGVAGVTVSVMNLKEFEMKYPIALKKIMGVESYKVSVPDLPGCECNGENVDVSLSKIYDSIATHLSILAEYGEAIPHATTIEHHLDKYPSVIWAVIDIDITPYLGKSHKINVTLPELLIKQIDDRVSKSSAYKTRSGFIASACMSELNQ